MGEQHKIIYSLLILYLIGVVSASIQTDDEENSYPPLAENTSRIFSFMINDTGEVNLTRIEVTIPAAFTYQANSNGTNNNTFTFSTPTGKLAWSGNITLNNSGYLFWFTARSGTNASEQGFLITTFNGSNTYESQNLTVTIIDTQAPNITVHTPLASTTYTTEFIMLNVSINEDGYCIYSQNRGASNITFSNEGTRLFSRNTSFADGSITLYFFCKDSADNWKTSIVSFSADYESSVVVSPTPTTPTANTTLPPTTSITPPPTTPRTTTNATTTPPRNTTGNSSQDIASNSFMKWVVVLILVLIAFALIVVVLIKSKQDEY